MYSVTLCADCILYLFSEFIMYEIIVFVAIVWAVIQIRKWMLLRPMMHSLESKHVVVSKIN